MTPTAYSRADLREDGINAIDTAALLDVAAVAALLSCSTRTIRRLADAGRMPRPVPIGGLRRWHALTGDPMTGVRDWIAAGCPSCRSDRRAGK